LAYIAAIEAEYIGYVRLSWNLENESQKKPEHLGGSPFGETDPLILPE